MDSTNIGQGTTIVFTILKNSHISGPVQLKTMLFKSQLYFSDKKLPIYSLTIISRRQNGRENSV